MYPILITAKSRDMIEVWVRVSKCYKKPNFVQFIHFNSYLKQKGIQMESKMQNRNRKAECNVCGKAMRSDHLKRHKKIHKDLLSLPDNEIKDELKSRQEIKKKQEEKIQKVVEIARENDLAIPDEIVSEKRESVEKIDDVRAKCLQSQQLYLEKIELGKQIANIVETGEVMYEALGKEYKEAFNTYRKYLKVDISDFILRKWQEDAMKFFDSEIQLKDLVSIA